MKLTDIHVFLIALASLATSGISAEPTATPDPDMTTLMTFEKSAEEAPWTAVNDGVMGGLSKGSATLKDEMLIFSGTLSLENNGGFSSVRSGGNWNLSDSKAIVLRVKGDGRTYQLRLSTDARYRDDRVAYSASFSTTPDKWIEVRLPFDDFSPSYRGRQLDGPPLDRKKIEEIGVLIGDKRAGPFKIEVEWIRAE